MGFAFGDGGAWRRLRQVAVLLVLVFAASAALATEKPMPPTIPGNPPKAPGISNLPSTPAPPPQTRSFQRYSHYDLGAGDEWQSDAWDAPGCETKCQENSACTGFTYDGWNRRCFLKRDLGGIRMNPRATSGVLASEPQPVKSGAPVVMKYYNNRAFPGRADQSLAAGDRDGCERACWGVASCIGFSFHKAERRCDLFDNPQEYGKQAGVFSGAKEQDAN